MMKVGLIEPVGGHGGMNYYDYSLAKGLSGSGVSVNWYTCDKTSEVSSEYVKVFKLFNGVFGHFPKIIRFFLFCIGLILTLVHARFTKCNLVHLHFFHFGAIEFIMVIASKVFLFPVVITVHDVESFSGQSFGFFEKIIIFFTNFFIVHNQISKKSLLMRHKNIAEKVEVIPHGDYGAYVREKDCSLSKAVVGVDPSKMNFLFFGQIKKVKGLMTLLHAIADLRNRGIDGFMLTIAGKVWKDSFNSYQKYIDDNIEELVLLLKLQ